MRAVDTGGRPVAARFSLFSAEGQERPRSPKAATSWLGPDSDPRPTERIVAFVRSCPLVRVEADGFRDAGVTISAEGDHPVVLKPALRVTVLIRRLAVAAEVRAYLTLHAEGSGRALLRDRDQEGFAPDGAAQVEIVSGGVYAFTVSAPGTWRCAVRWEDRTAAGPAQDTCLGWQPARWSEVLMAPLEIADCVDQRFSVELDVTRAADRRAGLPNTRWVPVLGVPLDLRDEGWIPAADAPRGAALAR